MPTFSRVTDLEEMETPWGKSVRLQEIEYQGGEIMLRVRIREGRRFTDLELTRELAAGLGRSLAAWSGGSDGR